MKLIADESVDFGIIKALRANNFEVLSILEASPGIDDNSVLSIANKEKSILLTEDKDFGELVFRLQQSHYGVILLRLNGLSIEQKVDTALKFIKANISKMPNAFSVISPNQLRIKNYF